MKTKDLRYLIKVFDLDKNLLCSVICPFEDLYRHVDHYFGKDYVVNIYQLKDNESEV